MHSILALAANEDDPTTAALNATIACCCNPLPITEVPAVAHSILTRGVHSGMLAIVSCLMQALSVPIIPLACLHDFFAVDQVRYI